MNKKYLSLVLMTALFAAVFTSCKKDKENIYTVKLLEIITMCCSKSDGIDDDYFERYDKYKFEYDEQNRIIKVSEYYYGGDLNYTMMLTYAGDDLVQVLYSHSNGSETREYTKSGNTITEKYNGKIYTIELNSDGLPVTREEERSGSTLVETYYYKNGNMTQKAIRFTIPENDYSEYHTYNYGYDNEKSALYHCKTPKWWLIIHLNDFGVSNNITEENYIRHYGEYIYKFDGAGLPTKRTYKYIWGMAGHERELVEEFTYIKK